MPVAQGVGDGEEGPVGGAGVLQEGQGVAVLFGLVAETSGVDGACDFAGPFVEAGVEFSCDAFLLFGAYDGDGALCTLRAL